jgi:DNA mismatch endonuclease (patch repair protein)
MGLNEPSDHVRARMQKQPRAGTSPELKLRRILFARGLRYRVGMRVPGQPRRTIDIAFPGKRLAVFVDGCFWHLCPVHSVPVKNNSAWWANKLKANVARDQATTRWLEEQGWQVIRVWEHEDPEEVAQVIEHALRGVR